MPLPLNPKSVFEPNCPGQLAFCVTKSSPITYVTAQLWAQKQHQELCVQNTFRSGIILVNAVQWSGFEVRCIAFVAVP